MTDKEKLEKIKELADVMYNAAFNMTTDASLLRKAMKKYHQFVIHEYHKEDSVNNGLDLGCGVIWRDKEPASEDLDSFSIKYAQDKPHPVTVCQAVRVGANWQKVKDQETIETAIHYAYHNGKLEMKEQLMANAVDATIMHFFSTSDNNTPKGRVIFCSNTLDNYKIEEKVKVVIIKKE